MSLTKAIENSRKHRQERVEAPVQYSFYLTVPRLVDNIELPKQEAIAEMVKPFDKYGVKWQVVDTPPGWRN